MAFALSGYVVSLTENIVYLYSICALPIFCAALEKALAERWVWVVSPAVIWATVFLNGDIQITAVGAFTLGRVLGFSRAGALLAGVAFALSGYVVSLTENIVYLYSICALPIFCAALEKALAERWVWVVSPAVIWATVFLNGDIQTGYYYGFIAMVWTVMRARGFYREACLRLACAGALAGLLAGIQLGPAAALFVNSERTQAALFHDSR